MVINYFIIQVNPQREIRGGDRKFCQQSLHADIFVEDFFTRTRFLACLGRCTNSKGFEIRRAYLFSCKARATFPFLFHRLLHAQCFDNFLHILSYLFLQIHLTLKNPGGKTMTSFGLFSVNQLSSHPHVSRTNYATAMDAQDRLQKLHDPNAFQAAHPSGRLGRILEKKNGANAGDQSTDEPMSAESSAVEGRTLPEDNPVEGSTGAAASFVPIQPRQAVVPTVTSPVAAVPVAQMSTQGPPQPGIMAPGALPNPLHGSPQQPLVPRYLDNRPHQAFYGLLNSIMLWLGK